MSPAPRRWSTTAAGTTTGCCVSRSGPTARPFGRDTWAPRGSRRARGATPPARVLIADTEPIFAAGARETLAEAGFDPAVMDASFPVAPRAAKLRPEALLLDATLGNRPYAADLVATLAARTPEVGVVVLVRRAHAAGIVEAMEAGARALVHRQCTTEELVAAVLAAVNGQNWVAAPLAGVLREELLTEVSGDRPKQLSPRELEVLRWLASGAGNAEIGQRLGISENTVRNHVHSLMGKLGVANRTDAVATGLRRGLVELPG